jgi:aspartyl-tRNA(Asn)/glutamyl-tRNA(Gln) amidotransferase subunit B
VPLAPERALVDRLREGLPELPAAMIVRLANEVGTRPAEELVLTGNAEKAELLAKNGLPWVAAASASMNELSSANVSLENAEQLAKVFNVKSEIPRESLTAAIEASQEPGFTAEAYIAERAVSDTSELEPVIDAILSANPGQVAAYQGGKEGLLGFFVGQVMKETNGKANPKVVNELLREKLKA